MLDYLIAHGFTVHLSRGMVVLEKAGMLADFPTLTEAYTYAAGIDAMEDA
jgi:hypothetical protein